MEGSTMLLETSPKDVVLVFHWCVTNHHRQYSLVSSQFCRWAGLTGSLLTFSQAKIKVLTRPNSYLRALGKNPLQSSFMPLTEFSSLQLWD